MLEIGNSLRTARGRRGLELAQVDADTHIRMRYLAALEDERFDLVPGAAYVRGFLRTYANYLGLEADPFVDEYNARFAPPEEPPPLLVSGRPGRFRVPAAFVAVLALALVPLIAWKIDSGSTPKRTAVAANPVAPTNPIPSRPQANVLVPPSRPARKASLVLAAGRGSCWLSVHIGSSAGQNLDAILNGKHATLPDDTADVVVTGTGIRTVAVG